MTTPTTPAPESDTPLTDAAFKWIWERSEYENNQRRRNACLELERRLSAANAELRIAREANWKYAFENARLRSACEKLLTSESVQNSWPILGGKRAEKPSDTFSRADARVRFRDLLCIHEALAAAPSGQRSSLADLASLLEERGAIAIWRGYWAEHTENAGKPIVTISTMDEDGQETDEEIGRGETLDEALDRTKEGA